jgi:CBS domain-containing protein
MDRDLQECTIYSYPHAFVSRVGDPILITTLNDKRAGQLVDMYLNFRPRNSFQGLPPIADEACEKWAKQMIGHGVNLAALSFDVGVVGHVVLFPIDNDACELLAVVSPDFQNTGIGTELVRCAAQLSDEIGWEEIRLTVEMTNPMARRVYTKCGFEYSSAELDGEVDMKLDLKRYRATVSVRIGDIMNHCVITVRTDHPCRAALEIFLSSPIASLPVVDKHGKLEGIITKTDLMIPANLDKKIGEVYTQNVVTVHEGHTVSRVIRMLQSKGFRAIPVVDRHKKLVGVVGRREILNYYAAHL